MLVLLRHTLNEIVRPAWMSDLRVQGMHEEVSKKIGRQEVLMMYFRLEGDCKWTERSDAKAGHEECAMVN